jgi:hypothetical protein
MSNTTISSSEAGAPSSSRLRGAELRRALAASVRLKLGRAGRSGARLGPGERIIGGRVLYSAAWLDETRACERRRRSLKQLRLEGLPLSQKWSRLRSLGADRQRDLERVR